jgi:hypothetical protein
MLLAAQTIDPTLSSSPAEFVSGNEVADQQDRRPQRADHEHGYQPNRESAKPLRAASDLTRISDDNGDEK